MQKPQIKILERISGLFSSKDLKRRHKQDLQGEHRFQRKCEDRLFLICITHPLTGLFNKASFETFLNHAIKKIHKGDQLSIALIFTDLDKFKQVNDKYGHVLGDNLLRALGKRLQKQLRREDDFLSHWAGDEFGIIGSRVTKESLDNFTSKLEKIMQNVMPDSSIHVRGSIGAITTDNLYEHWKELSNGDKKPPKKDVLKAISFLEGKKPDGNFKEALNATRITIFSIVDAKMYDIKAQNNLKFTPANDVKSSQKTIKPRVPSAG